MLTKARIPTIRFCQSWNSCQYECQACTGQQPRFVIINFVIPFSFRKLFSMDDILRKYQGKDIAKSKEKVENSLPLFDKVGEPDQDFLTEIELLRHYREESFPLLKVNHHFIFIILLFINTVVINVFLRFSATKQGK